MEFGPIYEAPLEDSSVAYMSYADFFKPQPGALWNVPEVEVIASGWRSIALAIVDRWRGSEFTYRAMNQDNAAMMAAVAIRRNEQAIDRLPTQGEYLT